jgi:HEPN superfamily RiboL-PSP-like protein
VRWELVPSTARTQLSTRLADVERLVEVYRGLPGSNAKGRKRTHGPAVTRAGFMLLYAALEAFVEELYEEAGNLIFSSLPAADRKALYDQTSEKLNTANVHKTNLLYFNLGIPWLLRDIRWQKFSNATFQAWLNRLVEVRGQIAHGRMPHLSFSQLSANRARLAKYAEVLERRVADYIEERTENRPTW